MKTNALMVYASIQEREANVKEKVVKIDQQANVSSSLFWGLMNIILNNEHSLFKNEQLPHVIYQ